MRKPLASIRSSVLILAVSLGCAALMPAAAPAAAGPGTRISLAGAGLSRHFRSGLEQGAVAAAVIRQPGGRLVVAGTLTSNPAGDRTPATSRVVLVRFTSSGRLDSTFGDHGKVVTDLSGSHETVTSLMRQTNGRLVVAAHAHGGMMLVRYTPGGRVDRSFGCRGVAFIHGPFLPNSVPNAVRPAAGGRILVAGSTGFQSGGAALVQLRSNGRIDTAFGQGGKVVLRPSPRASRLTGVVVDHAGRILVSGTTGVTALVARLSRLGVLDGTFGAGGLATVPDATGHGLVLDAQGRVLLAGGNLQGTQRGLMVARFDGRGAPDPGFGVEGVSRIVSVPAAGPVVLDGPGRPLVTGIASAGSTCAFLGRLSATGALDPTFRPGGTEPEPAAPCSSASQVLDVSARGPDGGRSEYVALVLQPNGEIVTVGAMGGDEVGEGGPELVLARFRG